MDRHLIARGRRALLGLALAAAVCALVVPVTAQPAGTAQSGAARRSPAARSASKCAATIRDGRAAARRLLKTTGAASLSLAFTSGDRVIWRQTFGYADKAKQTPPGPDTVYGIGSVSKMLATVAVMKLVD
jgi:CubicO group peptidase (beta-lactamase class C family)